MKTSELMQLYEDAFKVKTNKRFLSKLINEARGEEKQRLKELQLFASCVDLDKADPSDIFEAIVTLNKSYRVWQEIFKYMLTALMKEEVKEGDTKENITEESHNRTLSDDDIEFITEDSNRGRIEDYDEDYEDDYEELEEEEEE